MFQEFAMEATWNELEVHPSIGKKIGIFFNNVTSMVTKCFMIIMQGSKWVHVGMGREKKPCKNEDVMSRFYIYCNLFCQKNLKPTSTFLPRTLRG